MSRMFLGAMSIVIALGVGALATSSASLAQDATPTGSIPTCVNVATPSVDSAVQDAASSGTPSATPSSSEAVTADELPQGQPADTDTAAAADQLVQTWLACYLGGEELAVLALQSDQLDQSFLGQLGQTPDEVQFILEEDAQSTPIPVDSHVMISSGQDVRVLDDGRIGGIWSLNGDAAFVILIQEDGVWVIDEIIDLIDEEGTPTP